MASMHNPPHPGQVLLDGVFSETGLSTEDFAARIGVPHVLLLRVLDGLDPVSPDLALRLAAALGGDAESWLHMQASFDLWQARQQPRPAIDRLKFQNI
ncbi:HigA family addiction module antitoxin [Pseudoduganella sp. LjRoot289]|uniref:HigA family addiction module antitoxin n=1 Tax=Pseudoduganella sp. LjRoot289 TaxID=3342314 RepID=UPI003ECDBDDD